MKKSLQLQLVKDFPKLYANYHKSIYESSMAWGFECGDGWYDIIREASQKIEDIINTYEDNSYPVAEQVKSKFLEIRFYLSHYRDEEINKIIRRLETKALNICMRCGKQISECDEKSCIAEWRKKQWEKGPSMISF